jgi:hypothetical protein
MDYRPLTVWLLRGTLTGGERLRLEQLFVELASLD